MVQHDHVGPPAGPLDAWLIHNDKLYLLYTPRIREQFQQNLEANLAAGDERWIGWWGALEAGPFNLQCNKDNECVADGYQQAIPGITDR